jgi:hypothetical protein
MRSALGVLGGIARSLLRTGPRPVLGDFLFMRRSLAERARGNVVAKRNERAKRAVVEALRVRLSRTFKVPRVDRTTSRRRRPVTATAWQHGVANRVRSHSVGHSCRSSCAHN